MKKLLYSFSVFMLYLVFSASSYSHEVINVSEYRPTSQSSTGFGGASSKAVDGNTNGWWADGSVTHTNNDIGAWWEVDLEQEYSISSIEIWNRTDCCEYRLSNFSVKILDEDRTVTKAFVVNNLSGNSLILNADDDTGRYIRVQLEGQNYLSLAEVRVYAENPDLTQGQ